MNKSYIILKDNIRIIASDMTQVANEAIKIQKTTPLSSLILGVAMSVFSPLGSLQKEGFVQAIYKPKSTLKTIIVESSANGEIRAMIDNKNIHSEYDKDINKINKVPLQILTGASGSLKIIKNVKGKTFGGEVNIVKGDFVTDLAYYFDQSEQIKSGVLSDVKLKSEKEFQRVFSVIFQLLPNHKEKDIKWIEKKIKEKLSSYKTIEEYIKSLNGKILSTDKLVWKCKCSNEKSQAIIDSLTAKEKEDIIKEHGKLEVICNFCTKSYTFKK